MKAQLSPEELDAVWNYLEQRGGQPMQRQFHEEYTAHETDIIFPAIQKLLSYGAQKQGRQQPGDTHNLSFMLSSTRDNPQYVRSIVEREDSLLRRLYREYEGEIQQKKTNDLFSKKLSEMTGYEFQEYAKKIGLIK